MNQPFGTAEDGKVRIVADYSADNALVDYLIIQGLTFKVSSWKYDL